MGLQNASRLAHDHHIDTPILLAPGHGVVGGYGIRFTVPTGGKAIWADAVADQELPDGIGPAPRQIEVSGFRTGTVGITFDEHITRRILLEKFSQLVKVAHRPRPEIRLVDLE